MSYYIYSPQIKWKNAQKQSIMSTLIISFIVLAIIIGIAHIVTSHKHEEVTVQVEETPLPLKGGEIMHHASSVVVPFGSKTGNPDYQTIGRAISNPKGSPVHYIADVNSNGDSDGDFATSMLVAEMTDSAILGAAVGGDIIGAMIGEEIAESNRETTNDSDGVYQSPMYEEDQQDNSYTPDTKDDSYSSNDSTSYDSDSSSSSYGSGSDD